MEALNRLRNAGFSVEVDGEDLLITPGDSLTDQQTAWIRQHKAELMAELRAANDADALTVVVWTPSGIAMRTRADSPEHADWLRRMNPKPTHPRPVLPPETAAQSDRESVATGSLV